MSQIVKNQNNTASFRLRIAYAKYYTLINVFLFVAVLGAGYYTLLRPKYETIWYGDGGLGRVSLQTEIENRESALTIIKALISNYQQINQNDINKINDILPNQKDIPGLIVTASALAEQNGFLLDSINLNDVPEVVTLGQDDTEVERVSMSLNLIDVNNGGYPQLKQLLLAIENNLRLFDVTAIYFNQGSSLYSLNIMAYYVKH
jgi:hypothetical protein